MNYSEMYPHYDEDMTVRDGKRDDESWTDYFNRLAIPFIIVEDDTRAQKTPPESN